MKKMVVFINLLILICGASVQAEIKVVASLPVFAALAQAIGGENVQVKTLARPNQDPHFLQAKPKYVVDLNRADVLLHSGMGLEAGWLPAAVLQSRNPKIQRNATGDVDLSRVIQPLEVPPPGVDRGSGDIHPQGNPHYWLDPRNGFPMARAIVKILGEVDPGNFTTYQKNYQNFTKALEEQLKIWQPKISKLRGLKVYTFHLTWSYFANFSGIQVVEQLEPKPGIPPNSKHVERLISLVKPEAVKVLLMAPYYPRKVPEYLTQKTAIPLLVAETQPLEANAAGYFKMFNDLLNRLTSS